MSTIKEERVIKKVDGQNNPVNVRILKDHYHGKKICGVTRESDNKFCGEPVSYQYMLVEDTATEPVIQAVYWCCSSERHRNFSQGMMEGLFSIMYEDKIPDGLELDVIK